LLGRYVNQRKDVDPYLRIDAQTSVGL
jgi:hypothetical protein